jgi:hypothetical protein
MRKRTSIPSYKPFYNPLILCSDLVYDLCPFELLDFKTNKNALLAEILTSKDYHRSKEVSIIWNLLRI